MKKQRSLNQLFINIIILFSVFNCNTHIIAETRNPNSNINIAMKTIKEQKLNNQYEIKFNRESDSTKYVWNAILVNLKTDKSITLRSDTIVKNNMWVARENTSEDPANLYNMIGCYLYKKDLYVVYDEFGKIALFRYHFTDSDKFDVQSRLLSTRFVSPSYSRFLYEASFKNIESVLYLHVDHRKSSLDDKLSDLYVIGEDFSVSRMQITNQNYQRVMAFRVENGMRQRLEYMSKHVVSDKDKEKYEPLRPYIDSSYYEVLDPNLEERWEQKSRLVQKSLFTYDPYTISKDGYIDSTVVKSTLKEVLSVCKLDDSARVLGYLVNNVAEEIYFFLSTPNSGKRRIIVYSKFPQTFPMWSLPEYEENPMPDN